MKYPMYPEYKDSGVEWIGEIPEHWNLSRIKFVSEVTMGQSPPSDFYIDNGKIPFLQGCGEFGEISPNPKHYCDIATKTSRPRDILLSVRAPVGEINLSDRVYGIGRGLCSIRPLKCKGDYLKWYLYAARNELISISSGSTYDAVAIDDIKNLEIPISRIEIEQNAICEYLNNETSKIDSLISKEQQLIGLLKEKRQAIITHAVTKGLDPNVSMKDSGVEWIGEIPEHWNLSRIKFVSEVTMGQSPPSDFYIDNGKIPFLQGCGEFGEISPNPKHYCDIATKTSRPRDILLSVRAPVGEINLSDRVYGIGRGLCSIRPLKCKGDYLKWYLYAARNELISISSGSTYDAVAIDDIKNLEIPISRIEIEQNAICEYLNNETSKIDNLIAKNSKLIDVLKEYKHSIITQAVTGKIDVRGLTVPAKSNSSEA
jgi:type I restriction enzyme S subunit